MPGGYARKRMHDGHTRLRRRLRLRNKTKDLDQVKNTQKSCRYQWICELTFNNFVFKM